MTTPEEPRWLPYLIYISTNQFGSEKDSLGIVEKLFQKYGGIYSKDFNSLGFRIGSVSTYVRSLRKGGS